MRRFYMNGYEWWVIRVSPDSHYLIDRTGALTVATTDPTALTIYISSALSGEFFTRVLIHELGHATMFSYYLVDDIHSMVPPDKWIEAEEWTCNFLADYGQNVFRVLDDLYFQGGRS